MPRKSFSISADLAKGIRNSVNTGSQNRGQLNYDIMSIDAIEPDPDNPRQLELTLDDINNGINKADPKFRDKRVEYEKLLPLADSIKRVGIRNAIEVYKNGGKYRIISGERRLLASIIAKKTHIPVRISNKPDEFKLRYLQWIENLQREDLTLWEKYQNLQQLVNNYHKNGNAIMDAKSLSNLLGVSARQAYRYLNLLNAEQDLLSVMKEKKLNNLKIFNEIAQLKEPAIRMKVIQQLKAGEGNSQIVQEIKASLQVEKQDKAMSARRSKGKGRPTQQINFGKINDFNVAKKLVEMIIAHKDLTKHADQFSNIDWSCAKSINLAFKSILRAIEQQIASL